MEQKFTSLRVIAVIFKVLAWITLILGLLGAIALFAMGTRPGLFRGAPLPRVAMGGGLIGAITVAVVAVIYFLFLYAAGDGIYLFLAIEENTRATARYLAQGRGPTPPA